LSATCGWNDERKKAVLLTRETLPKTIPDVGALEELLCRPSEALIEDLRKVEGDIIILGVSGKMGPTLAGLAKAAVPERRVIGVARFSEAGVRGWLQARGVEEINCDLLDQGFAQGAERGVHGRPQVRRRG
jgi:hypothetical protein